MSVLKKFEKNTKGKDYVVGDIHGTYTKLYEQLDAIGFNKETDRLFCVGDLIDRGMESEHVLDFLSLPYVHAVMGNHEQMCIDAFNEGGAIRMGGAVSCFYMNGGRWWESVPQAKKNVIAYELMELPLAIEVETDYGRVGIVHADVPYSDWEEIYKLEGTQDNMKTEGIKNIMLWSRDRINNSITSGVNNIDRVYVGHTPLNDSISLGNVTYIDTGACFSDGKFTIVCIQGEAQCGII